MNMVYILWYSIGYKTQKVVLNVTRFVVCNQKVVDKVLGSDVYIYQMESCPIGDEKREGENQDIIW